MMLVNVFLIENTHDLDFEYRLFKIRGIPEDSEDFERNLQFLCTHLAYLTKSPFAPWYQEGSLYVVQPTGCQEPPAQVELVGAVALVEPTGECQHIRLDDFTDDEASIIIRFLSFYLQNPLFRNPDLWQPSAGHPFFQKLPTRSSRDIQTEIDIYPGFKMRPVVLPGRRLGICVDVTYKYVARDSLPANLSRGDVRHLRGKHAIYEYGKDWYEIKIEGSSDLNVGEFLLPEGVSLYDYIMQKAHREKVQRAMAIPKDCTVLTYRTGLGEVRNVPSALCRLTYGTGHDEVRNLHGISILPPHKRRQAIERVVNEYFKNLSFIDKKLRIQPTMLRIEELNILPPPLMFGQGNVLTVGDDAEKDVQLSEFAAAKRNLLLSRTAGFYSSQVLGRQYLFMPRSMRETIGDAFVEDVKGAFKKIFGWRANQTHNPTILSYDDSVKQTIHAIGESVLNSASQYAKTPGHALVILPRLGIRDHNKEDELANMILLRLREQGIMAACSHTEVPFSSYQRIDNAGKTIWTLTRDERKRSRYRGYLDNLVLNKILLNNFRWPFILASPLHADLIIGIDVKGATAGFTIIPAEGDVLGFMPSKSQQREKLARAHIRKRFGEFLKEYLNINGTPVRHLVVHRDGKLYGSEIYGLKDVMDDLRSEGLIEPDCKLTLVEIQKTSRAPIRFFYTRKQEGTWQEWTENPKVGTYMETTEGAILCTTGLPYKHRGTTSPIQIRVVKGDMPIQQVIEDVFALANLTWTKVDSCSKLPLSIKWTDIRLREIAGEFDEDIAEFGEDESENEMEDDSGE